MRLLEDAMDERLLRRTEAAEMLGCSVPTLERLAARGEVPAPRRLSRGRCGWLVSELAAHLRALPVEPMRDRTAAARAARGRGEAA